MPVLASFLSGSSFGLHMVSKNGQLEEDMEVRDLGGWCLAKN